MWADSGSDSLAGRLIWEGNGMKIINLIENTPGTGGCLYEHGLSFYIETKHHKLLMDTGASGAALTNARLLGIDLAGVDMVILSHGHYDHSGGILAFARENSHARIYMRRNAGGDYYHVGPGDCRYIGIDREILKLPGLVLTDGDCRIDEELFLFTGITGQRCLTRSNLKLKERDGDQYAQDTFDHEQCLVVTDHGRHILFSGCAHNGILNILDRYHELFKGYPDLVISGFHLAQEEAYTGEDIQVIQGIARELLKTGVLCYTGHCTGPEAFAMMKEIMGDRLVYVHSGEQVL